MERRSSTNRVIFHHSLSRDVTADTIREWHLARGFDDIGYHAVIHPDGRLEPGRNLEMVGAHARGRNHDSLGVCLTGDFRYYEPTVEALAAAQRYYHAVCRRYGKRLKVEFHRWRIDIIHKPCPGPKLDRGDFLELMYRACPFRGW
jgi:hypothetical protein